MANIQETTNYDRFELLDFNRDVCKTTALETSMRSYGWLDPYPMHVVKNGNGKLKIKAGHHRFHVARKLGIPCKYVVTEDRGESIHELEKATRRWSMQDYLTSFSRIGNEHYLAVQKYRDETGIPIQSCFSMLAGESAGSGNQNKKMKNGTYRIGDLTHANDVAEVVLGCAKRGVTFARHTRFVCAVSAVCRVPEFDRGVFLARVEANLGHMIPQPTRDTYVAMIEHVYNYGAKKNRLALAFMAKEVAARRNVCGLSQQRQTEPTP